VIGISTSGNSPNVINAIRLANSMEAKTIGFTGFNSGRLGSMVQVDLHVPSDSIEHVEDVHLMLEHLITRSLREQAWHLCPQPIHPDRSGCGLPGRVGWATGCEAAPRSKEYPAVLIRSGLR
jgi:hypothetical protein